MLICQIIKSIVKDSISVLLLFSERNVENLEFLHWYNLSSFSNEFLCSDWVEGIERKWEYLVGEEKRGEGRRILNIYYVQIINKREMRDILLIYISIHIFRWVSSNWKKYFLIEYKYFKMKIFYSVITDLLKLI